MPRSRYGNGTENWNVDEDGIRITWTHKNNPNLRVEIRRNPDTRIHYKYRISHIHPGPKGTVFIQPFEFRNNMADARKLVKMHLKHWNNPWQWASDPDFGKRGKQG